MRGKWLAEDPEVGIDLMVKDVDGKTVSLKKLTSNDAADVLSVWIASSGDTQKNIIREQNRNN